MLVDACFVSECSMLQGNPSSRVTGSTTLLAVLVTSFKVVQTLKTALRYYALFQWAVRCLIRIAARATGCT